MTVTSLIRAVIFPDPGASVSATTRFTPGDLLTGRVAEITANGKVLIDFGNLRVLADTDLVFRPGETIRVRVEETGEQIKLKHIFFTQPDTVAAKTAPGAAGRMLDPYFRLLPAAIDRVIQADQRASGSERLPDSIRQALHSIQNVLLPSLAPARPAETAALLRTLVENAGFFFEKRMESALGQPNAGGRVPTAAREGGSPSAVRQILDQDLKPNLFILKNFLDDPSGRSLSTFGDPEGIRSAVDRLLAGIERQQHQFRSHAGDTEPPPAFTVPFHLKENGQKGMLKVFVGSRSKKQPAAGTRISVMLSMDRIGDIQSDLLLLDKSLQITFQVADERVKRYLEQEIGSFTDLLTDLFSSVRIEVRHHRQLGQALEAEAARVLSDRKIDVRV